MKGVTALCFWSSSLHLPHTLHLCNDHSMVVGDVRTKQVKPISLITNSAKTNAGNALFVNNF